MNNLARYIIILAVAAAITIGVFSSLGTLAKPKSSEPQPPINNEITFETEYKTDNFERPPAPDTKGRGYQYFAPPEIPDPHAPIPPCTEHDRINPCTPIFNFRLVDPSPTNPIQRSKPEFPVYAEKSGHCTFDLEVNEQGKPTSTINLECTDPIFIEPTQKAALKWVFRPKIENGKLITYTATDQKVTYQLLDEDGNIISE